MECIVLVRISENSVVPITSGEEDDEMHIFPNYDAAVDFTVNSHLCSRRPYQIVELDEL